MGKEVVDLDVASIDTDEGRLLWLGRKNKLAISI
jgi:hypothetical protein